MQHVTLACFCASMRLHVAGDREPADRACVQASMGSELDAQLWKQERDRIAESKRLRRLLETERSDCRKQVLQARLLPDWACWHGNASTDG